MKRQSGLFRRKAPVRRTSMKRASQSINPIPGLKEDYYLPHIDESTWVCENCGEDIPHDHEWQRFTAQCHILAKEEEKFPEVAKEYANHFHGCLRCHNTFDTSPVSVVSKMPIIGILKDRLATFIHRVNPDNIRKIPTYLTE